MRNSQPPILRHFPARARGAAGLFLVFVFALAAAPVTAVRAAEDPGEGYEAVTARMEGMTVVRVDVRGNVATTPEQIKYWLSTREGQPFSERLVDGDYLRLANTGLFEDVQIKSQAMDGGLRLVVIVKEKALIRRVEFRGNVRVKERAIKKLVHSAVGQRYDEGTAASDRRAIEAHYQKEYYYFAHCRVSAEPFEDGVRLIFNIDEGGRVFVAGINMRGNKAYSNDELAAQAKLQTKPSGILIRGKFKRDEFERDLLRLKMFYQSKGYLDVDIAEQPFETVTDAEPGERWKRRDLYINIDIHEGQQYRVGTISFEGNELVDSEKLRSVMKTTPGSVYDAQLLDEDCKRIQDTYGLYPNSRYFTKVWKAPPLAEHGPVADVTIYLREGPEAILSSIRISGLQYTKEHVVLREMELFPGDKIDSRKWNRSRDNVHRLGYFKEPGFGQPDYARLVEDGDDAHGAAVFELEEDRTGKLSLMAGYSDRDGAIGSIGLSQRNFDFLDLPKTWKDFLTGQSFRGGGQYFNINLSRGQKADRYTVSFENPWIFGKPISFGVNAFYTDEEWDDFKERRTGFGLSLGKRLFDIPQLRGSIGFRLEQVKMHDFDSGVSQYWRDEEGTHLINRYYVNVRYDTRNSPYIPTKGNYLSATYELAGKVAGGDRDFWRGFIEAQTFLPIYEDRYARPWVLAFRGEAGWANAYGDDTSVPIYERLYAGGVGSVRGFENRTISPKDKNSSNHDPIGGEGRTTASAELFVPVYRDMIRASTFFDVGTVWSHIGDGPTDWRRAMGVGLHIKVPISPMPIMLYYSWIQGRQPWDEDERFQFSLGMLF